MSAGAAAHPAVASSAEGEGIASASLLLERGHDVHVPGEHEPPPVPLGLGADPGDDIGLAAVGGERLRAIRTPGPVEVVAEEVRERQVAVVAGGVEARPAGPAARGRRAVTRTELRCRAPWPGGRCARDLAHPWLQLGVGVLPEVHEAAVAVGGLGAVALGLVQLARALESLRQPVGVIPVTGHAGHVDALVVQRERAVRAARGVGQLRQLEQPAGAAFAAPGVPVAIVGPGLLGVVIRLREQSRGQRVERIAAAGRFGRRPRTPSRCAAPRPACRFWRTRWRDRHTGG